MDTVSELVAAGKRHFEQKDYHKAEACLRQVLDKTDRYADVLNIMGVIHHADGRFSSAIEMFKRALSINPRYTEALMNLAVLYNDLGKYDDAKKLYRQLKTTPKVKKQAIEPVLRGKLSNLHASIGDIYRAAGVHKLAIDEFEKALKLNPTYVDIKTKLGQCLREDGRLAKALKVLKEAIKTKGGYTPARIQLGLTYYAMGNTAAAKREWKAALAKDPGNDYATMYLRLIDAMTATSTKTAGRSTKKKT